MMKTSFWEAAILAYGCSLVYVPKMPPDQRREVGTRVTEILNPRRLLEAAET
jgi:hypothetical protein